MARTKLLSLRKPSWSARCHGRDISSSKILWSQYGCTWRNLRILAKSVSLFWIGVPVIAQRLSARRAQHAWASWLWAFWMTWAGLVSLSQENEDSTYPRREQLDAIRRKRLDPEYFEDFAFSKPMTMSERLWLRRRSAASAWYLSCSDRGKRGDEMCLVEYAFSLLESLQKRRNETKERDWDFPGLAKDFLEGLLTY